MRSWSEVKLVVSDCSTFHKRSYLNGHLHYAVSSTGFAFR